MQKINNYNNNNNNNNNNNLDYGADIHANMQVPSSIL